MRKIFFILLMAFSCSSWAEWTLFHTDEKANYFIDLDSIHTVKKLKRVWILSNKINTPISTTSLVEFDCEERRNRTIALNYHSAPNGLGEKKFIEIIPEWGFIQPRTIPESILNQVCKKS
jgi:hypothetical protein